MKQLLAMFAIAFLMVACGETKTSQSEEAVVEETVLEETPVVNPFAKYKENDLKIEDPKRTLNLNDKKWIDELKNIVKDSLEEGKLDVEGLASLVFFSSRQLNRKIKSITGLSTAKFIKEVQLQAAREELENGTFISISEVANKFGFEYPSTFSNVFKNRFGKSPNEFI